MQGYVAQRNPDGSIIQAGISSGASLPAQLTGNTMGLLTTAVVLATYYPNEEDREFVKGHQRAITCDVRTTNLRPSFLWRVPVCQWHQLHDENTYVPRATRQDLDGGESALIIEDAGPDTGMPTSAKRMDGDHVVVAFLDNSPTRPVILPFGLPHPSANTVHSSANGRVRRMRHNGTLVEWDKDGNITIDATGAAQEILGANGSEVSNSGIGGKITFKTKDGASAESSIVLDNLGSIKLTDAAGNYLEFTKASQTADLVAAFVNIASTPREPAMKATEFNKQNADMLSMISAAFAAIGAEAALTASAGPCASAVDAIADFTKAASGWTSTKVQVG